MDGVERGRVRGLGVEDAVMDGDAESFGCRAFVAGRSGRRWGWVGVLGAERSWVDAAVDRDG